MTKIINGRKIGPGASLSRAYLEGMIIDDGTYDEEGNLRTYVLVGVQ